MFEEFLVSNEVTDRAIQWALRETDEELLSAAMAAMSEDEREIVYRNVSDRVRKVLPDEVARAAASAPKNVQREAAQRLANRIRVFAKYTTERVERGNEPVKFDFSTPQAVLESFKTIGRLDRLRAALHDETVERDGADPFGAKALELVDDMWDPVTVREILTRLKATLLSEQAKRMDMIIDGVEALLNIEMPLLLQEKLAAHVAPSQR